MELKTSLHAYLSCLKFSHPFMGEQLSLFFLQLQSKLASPVLRHKSCLLQIRSLDLPGAFYPMPAWDFAILDEMYFSDWL